MAVERQAAALPPAQPTYIFRGHTAHIHSVQILHQNTRLLTGDADGWLVLWKLESKRPLALRISSDSDYSTVLPTDNASLHRPKPWLLHSLPVNTLNFCAFSMCHENAAENSQQNNRIGTLQGPASFTRISHAILVAAPARDDHKIEVYQFPDEKLVYVVPRVQTIDTGMVMAVKIIHHRPSSNLIVIAGYEGGFTAVHLLGPSPHISSKESMLRRVQVIYLSRPHTQPVLSLDASPDAKTFFTSSADATIARHCIPDTTLNINSSQLTSDSNSELSTSEQPQTTHPTNQTLELEPSEPLSFSKKPLTPLPNTTTNSSTTQTPPPPSGLSHILSTAPSLTRTKPSPPKPAEPALSPPQKTLQTKHSGQQSLTVRSDGRLLVTAGWDSRIRIYSAKSLREVAVLKWHKEGVYAVGFGDVWGEGKGEGDKIEGRVSGLSKLQVQREREIQGRRWVVAGAKDGKVSLWEVF
ncbi:WD40-repeat-containing domain protein [Dendryphion nanum]|uniref:ASTRA-associated protein 1 n=1 Tax=Dendryphion nanum TaxID=256645 RepID=A0A9P9IE04_9PLEO|nr:WD40-repeat-containing domain protein [Dendryphion nanum]